MSWKQYQLEKPPIGKKVFIQYRIRLLGTSTLVARYGVFQFNEDDYIYEVNGDRCINKGQIDFWQIFREPHPKDFINF